MGRRGEIHKVKARKVVCYQASEADVAQLEQQVHQLAADNKALFFRHELLVSLSVAANQAAIALQQLDDSHRGPDWGPLTPDGQPKSGSDRRRAASKRLAHDVDVLISTHSDVAPYFVNDVPQPVDPDPGCARRFLFDALHDDQLATRSLHASLLDGGPTSMFVCSVLCLRSDPQLVDEILHWEQRFRRSIAARRQSWSAFCRSTKQQQILCTRRPCYASWLSPYTLASPST